MKDQKAPKHQDQKDTDKAHNVSVKEYDELAKEAEETRTKKPGSQAHNSDRHNNGRGGGK